MRRKRARDAELLVEIRTLLLFCRDIRSHKRKTGKKHRQETYRTQTKRTETNKKGPHPYPWNHKNLEEETLQAMECISSLRSPGQPLPVTQWAVTVSLWIWGLPCPLCLLVRPASLNQCIIETENHITLKPHLWQKHSKPPKLWHLVVCPSQSFVKQKQRPGWKARNPDLNFMWKIQDADFKNETKFENHFQLHSATLPDACHF